MTAKILIVEDEAITAMDIRNILESADFEVISIVSSGKEAIQKAEELKPDLILIDVFLKGEIDGIEAASKIMTSFDIPVIYLTAYSDKNTFQRAKLTKPYGFLTKPIDTNELIATIEIALYKHNLNKKLKEREQKFQLLYQDAPLPYQSLSESGHIIEVNQAWLDTLGYSKDEVIGKWFGDFLKEDNTKKFIENFPKFKAKGEICNIAFEMKRKDGSIIITEFNGKISYDKQGNFQRTHCIFQDITVRRDAEEVLRESEERYHNLFKNNHAIMLLINPDTGDIVDANPSACSFYGYSNEKLKEMKITDLNMLTDEQVFEEIQKAKSNEKEHFIFKHRLVNGEIRDVDVYSGPITVKGKNILYSIIHDITKQTEAEKNLKESKEQYKQFFNNSLMGIALCKIHTDDENNPVDFTYLKVNKAFENFTGLKREEVLNKKVTDVLPYEDVAEVIQIYGKVALTRESKQFEYPIPSLNKYYEVSAFSPRKKQFIAFFTDITERKKAEEAVVFQAQLLSQTHEAIFSLDTNYLITYWNKAAEKIFGWMKEEVLGKNSNELLKTKIKDSSRSEVVAKLWTKGSWEGEAQYLHKDGTYSFADVNAAVLKDANGKELGIVIAARDITKRKKLEEELIKSYDNLELKVEERTAELEKLVKDLKLKEYLLDSANDSIFLHDLDGNILYVNDVAYKSRGYTKEELLGMNIQDLSPPELNEDIDPQIYEILKQGEFIFESADLHKDGSTILIEIHSRIIELDSKAFVLSVVHDITEKKKAKNQLKETIKELERSNRELQQFAYVSSHDLQEPLRTIASFTQLLEKRYKGKLDDDADEFIDFIVEASIRMKAQIEGLLEYSRVGTKGKEFKPVDMNKNLNQTIKSLDTSIKESNAEITFDELPTIMGDADQLQRVFQNLISNAIKFKKPKEPPLIHISSYKDENNDEYVFSIKDNGIGIEEQYSERIFTIFQRLHTREKYKGTGIGLSIVKRIIERHGGRIWVESELGVGSTFYFTIPVVQVENKDIV